MRALMLLKAFAIRQVRLSAPTKGIAVTTKVYQVLIWRAFFGMVLVAIGAATIFGLAVIAYGDDPAMNALAFNLGLASTVLISGIAQVMLLAGSWLIWSAFVRSNPPRWGPESRHPGPPRD
jgi:hypothetical protein